MQDNALSKSPTAIGGGRALELNVPPFRLQRWQRFVSQESAWHFVIWLTALRHKQLNEI